MSDWSLAAPKLCETTSLPLRASATCAAGSKPCSTSLRTRLRSASTFLGSRPASARVAGRRIALVLTLHACASRSPVLILEQPLVELAGRMPRQLEMEIDAARTLDWRQPLAAVLDELGLHLRPRT